MIALNTQPPSTKSNGRPSIAVGLTLFAFSLLLLAASKHDAFPKLLRAQSVRSVSAAPPAQARCPQLDLADDVLVVFKTGATAHNLVAVHLGTDLSCASHILAGSDLEEDIGGLLIQDVLQDVAGRIEDSDQEFMFYHKLQEVVDGGNLASEALRYAYDGPAKEDNRAWKLDKWKFLPLLESAVEQYPLKKWYIFMEDDTYIMWSNLLSFLERHDHTEARYFGAPVVIGDTEFAHGGSGYVMSQAAAHAAVKVLEQQPELAFNLARQHCCGDLITALVMREAGISVTRAWPLFQGDTPDTMNFARDEWCYPVTTLHHMSPEDVRAMWEFQGQMDLEEPISRRNIYAHFVKDRLRPILPMWDNMSSERHTFPSDDPPSTSFAACQAACEATDRCLQFSWVDGQCSVSGTLRLGEATRRIGSGFLLGRIEQYIERAGNCTKIDWDPLEWAQK